MRSFVLFRHDENTTYSPEELLAMILNHAKGIAEEYTEQKPIKDVVLTIPVFFNQAERKALSKAVELAGLNLLQLISEPMATALNYGMFRRKEINGTAKYLMFYDMVRYFKFYCHHHYNYNVFVFLFGFRELMIPLFLWLVTPLSKAKTEVSLKHILKHKSWV